MTDKEIIEKIYLGTMESASRKQINEANDLFKELKAEIYECTTFLMDLAKKLSIFEVDMKDYDSYTFEQEIKRIEELLNPNFIHFENKNVLSPKEEEYPPIDKNLSQYLPTAKETIERIFDHKKRLILS